jgi:hypothetical protein
MLALSERIADVLAALVRPNGEADDPNPTIEALTAALGKRSFGIVLVLFGLPNLLPIPGLPMLCGVVIGVIGVQMMLGAQSLKLPRWLSQRRIKRADLARLVSKAEPALRALEKLTRPRFSFLTSPQAERVLGAVVLALGVALQAPIPFFGGIAPGLGVVLLGLAMTERDGVLLVAGLVVSSFAMVFTFTLTYAIVRQIILFVLHAGGMIQT